MSAIPTVKVKANNAFGYKWVNSDEVTHDLEIYGDVVEVESIGEDVQIEGSDLPPVATHKKKRTAAKG
jgi:hypothetical protein